MPRALILGGTGLIGRATARRLVSSGWQVTVTGRDRSRLPPDLAAAEVEFSAADRDDPAAIAAALGDGADLLVDCIGYTAAQAELLLPLLAHVGSTAFLSSKAVYVDDAGRHSNTPDPPQFGGPITEDQPTMAPRRDLAVDDAIGYGSNKVAAEHVVLDSGHPVSVLRASKVHGEAARPAREWVFVKRALDRRPVVLLAERGAGVDHPSAAANIAALVEAVAGRPGRRVLNAADPDAPSALEISRAIARHMGHEWDEALLDADDASGLGHTPWDRHPPIVLDMSTAGELGYRAVGTYAETATEEIDWLRAIAVPGSDGVRLPDDWGHHGFFDGRFDYAAEDEYLARRAG